MRASDDPSTVQQLEGAIAALRAIVSNVASNDTLVRLHDDVHTLSSKVDQLVRQDSNDDSFAILEQRIAALTSTLESRERPAASENSEHIEGALRALSDRLDRMPADHDGTPAFAHLEEVLRALSDRIDRMPVGNDDASALAQLEDALRALSDRIDRLPVGNDGASAVAHLEQRVSYLLERLEASTDHRSGNLGRVEDGSSGRSASSRNPACGICRAGGEQPERARARQTPA